MDLDDIDVRLRELLHGDGRILGIMATRTTLVPATTDEAHGLPLTRPAGEAGSR